MGRLLQINPVLRTNTSTGRIVQEIGEVAMAHGWESYVAYSAGRDGDIACRSQKIPVGGKADVAFHGLLTRLCDAHGLGSAAATRRLVREIERLAPDVIHLHNLHGYFLNYKILFEYLARCNTPVVWTVHDCWLYTGHCYYYSAVGCDRWQSHCHTCPQRRRFPASWFIDRSRRNFEDKRAAFTAMPADRLTIVPVSEWLWGEMARSFMGGYRYEVIPNGIDTEAFCPRDEAARRAVRDKYALGDRCVILAVASIWSPEKGLDDLIRMANMLRPDEVLVVVGADRKTAAKLPSQAVPVARTANVAELSELYATAAALVNPTWQDNYPTVNMEAIASGTPVVTYRTGGSVEAVTDGTGYVVPQGDVAGMLEQVRRIAAAGPGAFSDTCRQYALAHFRKQDRYEAYIRLYESIAAR